MHFLSSGKTSAANSRTLCSAMSYGRSVDRPRGRGRALGPERIPTRDRLIPQRESAFGLGLGFTGALPQTGRLRTFLEEKGPAPEDTLFAALSRRRRRSMMLV